MLHPDEFAKLKIAEKSEGYYSTCLEALLAEGRMSGAYVLEVADIVLARAQLYLCNAADITADDFLPAFNSLAHCRVLLRFEN